uniref:hypothetical protein n=1 Tax=Bacillus multifaciens TaxID=3068506 RepID=UPI003F49A3C4
MTKFYVVNLGKRYTELVSLNNVYKNEKGKLYTTFFNGDYAVEQYFPDEARCIEAEFIADIEPAEHFEDAPFFERKSLWKVSEDEYLVMYHSDVDHMRSYVRIVNNDELKKHGIEVA